MLSIHITDTCNERCLFCVVGIPEPQFSKDTIQQKRIVKTLVENASKDYNEVNLHGGEPTVFKGLIDILNIIKWLKYPSVTIQTNGQRLSDLEFTQDLKDFNVNQAVVSLHGNSSKIHDYVTQSKGGFDNAVKGIKNALKVGMKVRTNTVITKQNISQLPDIVDFIIDLGVKYINISNIHPVFTAYRNFELVVPYITETRVGVVSAAKRAVKRKAILTLEGFPWCLVPGFEDYHIEYKRQKIDLEIRDNWINNYFDFMDTLRRKGEVCKGCKYENVCSGPYIEYIEKRGWHEFEDSSIYMSVHNTVNDQPRD